MSRTSPPVFQLPVDKIKRGYYSDQYFNHTKAIVENMMDPPNVTMQVFQKNHAVLAGIDEAIAVLKLCSGRFHQLPLQSIWEEGWNQLEVTALHEGDEIEPYEPVMHIEGPYNLFAQLETVYLGILARRTLIGTNVRKVIEAANGKPILYFPARHDHWTVQSGDGWAAHYAGAIGVSTDAQASWWGGRGMGTVPHALIAACGGDTVQAAILFAQAYAHEVNVTVLVDYDNDCAETAVEVADALKAENLPLWGVRLDTSESLVDRSLIGKMGQFKPTGVNPELVWEVRNALNRAGHNDIKIVASGGFTVDKIKQFEKCDVPVDSYGVGASLIRGANDFTADIVKVNGKECAKVGRHFIPNDRLGVVT